MPVLGTDNKALDGQALDFQHEWQAIPAEGLIHGLHGCPQVDIKAPWLWLNGMFGRNPPKNGAFNLRIVWIEIGGKINHIL